MIPYVNLHISMVLACVFPSIERAAHRSHGKGTKKKAAIAWDLGLAAGVKRCFGSVTDLR
jgi:hypothetical protein